ncbi:MAG: peptidoglycan DD-metalloendopeptidase family protein [Clostridia bacterium]|nr:peptidoglycan DD-metalloendopeptidase family protein [Clostridia bacterium]
MHRLFKKTAGFLHDRKKRAAVLCILGMALICAAVFGGAALISDLQNNAYRVYLGEEYLCAVKEEAELSSACDSFLTELRCPAVSQKFGNNPCRLEKARVPENELVSQSEVKESIVAYYSDAIGYGCGIIIDGKLFGAVSNEQVVESALEDLVSDTLLAYGGEEGKICEKVETQMGYFSRSIFIPDSELLARFEGNSLPEPAVKAATLQNGADESGEHIQNTSINETENGEDNVNIDEETTSEADPDAMIEENAVPLSSVPTISAEESAARFASAPVHAKISVREEYRRIIPYEQEYVTIEGYYSDYFYTEQDGEDGESLVCDLVTYLCGCEVGRQTLSETVLTEPVSEIIEIGATERPDGFEAGVQSGIFSWPAPTLWTITSYWGDGRGHKGMDISGSGAYGEPIVASDAGYVSWVSYGWSGGYGNYVDIDHGNGYVTRYAHCSDLCVEIGEPVAKGEIIAYVGSTGDSSGPHLHFEVIRWGEKRDPYPYLFEGICIDRC